MSRAMAGREVAITVPSIISMNSATARMAGMKRLKVAGAGEGVVGAILLCNENLKPRPIWGDRQSERNDPIEKRGR